MSTSGINPDEIRRLRAEYDRLPKVPDHGESSVRRHPDISPEWVMSVIEDPYDQWEEVTQSGQRRTVIVGRVRQANQWIKVVFAGAGDSRALITAYQDRRLERKYGGRPWPNQQ